MSGKLTTPCENPQKPDSSRVANVACRLMPCSLHFPVRARQNIVAQQERCHDLAENGRGGREDGRATVPTGKKPGRIEPATGCGPARRLAKLSLNAGERPTASVGGTGAEDGSGL